MQKMTHIKCRCGFYPFSNVARLAVPDTLVPWSSTWTDYCPPFYESKTLAGKSWADPVILNSNFYPKWNLLDGKINRESYEGNYLVDCKYPLNPKGRTGLKGRGVLGRWGPNHAADPIVSRWKFIDNIKQVHPHTKF